MALTIKCHFISRGVIISANLVLSSTAVNSDNRCYSLVIFWLQHRLSAAFTFGQKRLLCSLHITWGLHWFQGGGVSMRERGNNNEELIIKILQLKKMICALCSLKQWSRHAENKPATKYRKQTPVCCNMWDNWRQWTTNLPHQKGKFLLIGVSLQPSNIESPLIDYRCHFHHWQ